MQLTNPAAAPFRPLTGGEAIRLLARGMDLARHRPPPRPARSRAARSCGGRWTRWTLWEPLATGWSAAAAGGRTRAEPPGPRRGPVRMRPAREYRR